MGAVYLKLGVRGSIPPARLRTAAPLNYVVFSWTSSEASERLLSALDGSNLAGDGLGLLVDAGVCRLEVVDALVGLLALVNRSLHVVEQFRLRQQRAALAQVAVLLGVRVPRPLYRRLRRSLLHNH